MRRKRVIHAVVMILTLCVTGDATIAQSVFTLNGSASSLGGGIYRITSDQSHKRGAAWNNQQIDLSQPFDLSYLMYFGETDVTGADGMSFTIQNSSYGLTALGDDGQYMGYTFAVVVTPISPALNVEFDTYDNGPTYNDIPEDHISIYRDGDQTNPLVTTVPALSSGANIEDEEWHLIEIVWDPSAITLKVYFDCELRETLVYDLVNSIFGGNPVSYFGITGGTGSDHNLQKFQEVYINAGNDTTICNGSSITLNASSDLNSLHWTPSAGLSCTNCLNPVATPTVTTTYYLSGTMNCKSYQDSVTITVLSSSASSQNISICQGQSFYCGGAFQTASGTYHDTLSSAVGCDSIVTTFLAVNPTSAFLQNVSICQGQSYFCGGGFQTLSGIYVDHHLNHFGCDSTVTTNLTVHPNSSFTQNISICQGQSFFCGGSLQTTSGSYVDHYSNQFGCDSLRTTNLTVNPNSSSAQNISICQGQSYFCGGALQTTSGSYVDHYSNQFGCDSLRTTNLTVNPNSSSAQNISICQGQSYFCGGALQTTSGSYVDHYSNQFGCDSALTTNLTVNPNSLFIQNISICQGQSYFCGGALQTTSGSYVDHYSNQFGCDSLRTTNLTVNPNSSFTQNISICQGQSYFCGGALQSMSGSYVDHYSNQFSCDSIVTTNLSVLPLLSSSQNISICQGQSYFCGGALQTVSGVYHDTLTSVFGCDSVLTTNLSVLPNSSSSVNVSICQGQSYFCGGGLQTTSGNYIDHYSNYLGCDSSLTTNLTVVPNSSFIQNISICQGQSFYCGGANQTQSGVYFDTIANMGGCDSVITTNLNVLPNSTSFENISICFGDSIFLAGSFQTLSGSYIDHFINSVGCDSSLITNLSVLPVLISSQNISICLGQSYFCGGALETQSGIYHDSLTASTGCDSILTTNLTVLPSTSTDVYPFICSGEKYFAAGAWQTLTGIYVDTLSSFIGCDSTVITHLSVNPSPVVNLGNDTALCEGASVILNAGSGFQSYLWQDNSAAQFFTAKDFGAYWVIVTNAFGCTGADTIVIKDVYPLPKDFLPSDTLICGNIALTIDVPDFENYLWFSGDTSSSIVFMQEGTYWLRVTDAHGCSAVDSVHIKDGCDEDFLMPNAFTPNGDGLNDEFMPLIVHPMTTYDFKIFNRWGMMIFESRDPAAGWNGSDNGKNGELDVYVWVLDYTLESGEKKTAKGSVSLLH